MLHILRLESQREEAQTEQHQYSYTKSTNKLNPVKCAQISVMIWSRQKGHWNGRTHRLRSHTSQKSNGAVIIDSKGFFGCTAPCLFSSIFKINAAANAPGAWINTSRRASLSFYFDLFRLFGAEPRHFALSSSSLLFFGCFKSIVPLFFFSLSLFSISFFLAGSIPTPNESHQPKYSGMIALRCVNGLNSFRLLCLFVSLERKKSARIC